MLALTIVAVYSCNNNNNIAECVLCTHDYAQPRVGWRADLGTSAFTLTHTRAHDYVQRYTHTRHTRGVHFCLRDVKVICAHVPRERRTIISVQFRCKINTNDAKNSVVSIYCVITPWMEAAICTARPSGWKAWPRRQRLEYATVTCCEARRGGTTTVNNP